MESAEYRGYLKRKEEESEALCERCGECCGAGGDPCIHLARDRESGKYYCRVYEDRLGPQQTVSGSVFNCVNIKDNMRFGALTPNCAYNRLTSKFSGGKDENR